MSILASRHGLEQKTSAEFGLCNQSSFSKIQQTHLQVFLKTCWVEPLRLKIQSNQQLK
jgi:hypothetical protein